MKDGQGSADFRNPPVPTDGARQGRQVPGAPQPQPEDRASVPTPEVPPADGQAEPPHKNGIWKILAALGVGCLSVHVIALLMVMAGISTTLATCASSCSDSPVGDSREDAAFIANLTATQRDLATFDALRGCFDSMHEKLAAHDGTGLGSEERLNTVDELRAQIEGGTWPKDSGGSLSPQVWVRIAELSQDYLEQETGESWEIVDFSYPFPDNGPIPVPATRGEGSCTCTRLLCTQGDDEGLYAHVDYYRWRTPATFEDDLAERRQRRDESRTNLSAIESSGLLGTRDYVLDGDYLYLWVQGETDPLRDQQTFLQTALEFVPYLGDYGRVVLLAADTPVNVSYDVLSNNYPNNKPLQVMGHAEARERLPLSSGVLRFDCASGDMLYTVSLKTEDQRPTFDDVRGTLSAAGFDEYRHTWHAPDAGSAFDEQLAGVVSGEFGISPEELLVLSYYDATDSWGDEQTAWVVVPRGAFPETPNAFCSSMLSLRDVLWAQLDRDPERRLSLYVHVFMIDGNTILDGSGSPQSFAEMCEHVKADPQALGSYKVNVLLACLLDQTQWEGDDEPSSFGCKPSDVSGSIARSREWRYGDE